MTLIDFKQKISHVHYSIKENKSLLLYNLIFIFFIGMVMINFLVIDYSNRVQNDVTLTTQEFDGLELEFLCKLNNCEYIESYGEYFKLDKNKLVYSNYINKKSLYKFNDETSLTYDLKLCIKLKGTNNTLIIPFDAIFKNLYSFGVWILIILSGYNLYIIMIEFRQRSDEKFKNIIETENQVYNNSLIILTENLNHELNTPITVIGAKFQKFRRLTEYFKDQMRILKHPTEEDLIHIYDLHHNAYENDFKIVSAALSQITDILNKMKKFKYLKNEENNRNLYSVIESTFDIFLVTQSEKFEYTISNELKCYKANSEFLRNGEITGIILNLIKNAIEHGKATHMDVKLNNFNNDMVSFYFIDNGNGISEKDINNIFNVNYSTKINEKRGNGLYISKFLLEDGGGYIKLLQTSPSGTIFDIGIRSKQEKICITESEDFSEEKYKEFLLQ